MSLSIDQNFKTEFETLVHHELQAEMKPFQQFFRVKKADAKTVRFPKYGTGRATERTNIQTPIPVMNVGQSYVETSVRNFTAGDFTDIFANEQISFDDKQELSKVVARALYRQSLQLVIDVLNGATVPTAQTIAKNYGSGADDNLNDLKLRRAAALLKANGSTGDELTVMLTPYNTQNLLGNMRISSKDYTNGTVLPNATTFNQNVLGFDMFEVPDLVEGGLPLSTNDRTIYAFDKKAIGLAINMEPEIKIDWAPLHGAWFVCGYMSMNAVVIDNRGLVKIVCDESKFA